MKQYIYNMIYNTSPLSLGEGQGVRPLSFFFALILFLSSCSGDFLDHKPTDAVDAGIVPVPANAERIFNGAWYNLFESTSTYANMGYRALMLQDDMMADDVVSRPAYGFNSSYQFDDVAIPSNNRTAFAWYLMYKTIDNCNTAISITATGDDNTPAFRYAQGQAYALRAFCYLHLAQHYQFTYLKDPNAPAVPLYTEPTTPETQPKGKSTLEQIYTQIFADLNKANELLDGYVRPDDKTKFKPNNSVVNGLLARAYLLTGQWEAAATSALKAAQGYTLMTDAKVYMGFNDVSNTEWIWGHPQSVSQSNASYNFYYIDVVTPDAYNSFMADPHFMDTFTPGDIRLELFQWMREGYLGYRKFRIRADQTGDIVVMRSAEMYLIAAEALARNGQLGEAVKPLNTLRNARGLADYDLSGKSQDDVVAEILMERRRELWGEGFGITDILRTQQSVVRVALTTEEEAQVYDCWQQNGTYKKYNPEGHWFTSFPDATPFVPNSKYYLYAIPEKETNANPNLK